MAGSAKEIITPPLGTFLYGYPSKRPAAGVNDDLTAAAAVFTNGSVTAAVVSVTICSIPTSLCDRVRELVKNEIQIDGIIFCTSHTHSGPATVSTAGWGNADEYFIEEILIPKLIKVLKDAYAAVRPAEIGIGETQSYVGINRRQVKEDGSVRLGMNKWGIYDPRMRVISIRSTDDKSIIATMVHFGAHGTSAGGTNNPLITRDWSGIMTDRLEVLTGAPCLFLLGAEGDVAPRVTGPVYFADGKLNHDRIDQMTELGGRAAGDAANAYSAVRTYRVPEMKLIEGEIALPYERLPSAEEARDALKKIPEDAEGMEAYERKHWESVLDYADKPVQTALRYKQIILVLDNIAIVPHPFEIFQMIALRLGEYSPFEHTLSLANANGTNGYLPAKDDIARGGYEVWSARYRYGYLLTEDADTEIINQNLKLLRDNF